MKVLLFLSFLVLTMVLFTRENEKDIINKVKNGSIIQGGEDDVSFNIKDGVPNGRRF